MALQHATDANFSETIKDGLTLVDFWATWCGPCRMFGPIFESVSNKVSGVNFVKFEVDETNRQTPTIFGIRSIPSILAFRDGNLIEARTGLMDEETVIAWIRELQS